MGLMEKFADPSLIHSLSMGERLGGAGITTLMGMGITFVVLILLWLLLSVMAKVMAPKEGDKAPAAAAAAAPSGAESPAPVVSEGVSEELVAVITAAIAASEGGSASHLVVRKISRVSGEATAWGLAGRADCIDSRKF